MKVTLKPTPAVIKFAQEAQQVQDAINPTAVMFLLDRVVNHFRGSVIHPESNGQERTGPEMGIQNPITVLILDKLCSLARMEQASVIKADLACDDLIAGKDVEWEIDLF